MASLAALLSARDSLSQRLNVPFLDAFSSDLLDSKIILPGCVPV